MAGVQYPERLIRLARELVNPATARVLIEPLEASPGFWFGGGDLALDGDGGIVVCGRHRVAGDSRTGLRAGERGLELAVYRAPAFEATFEPVFRLEKAQVAPAGHEVLSIEGTSLLPTDEGFELFVSSEKAMAYPDTVRQYQKPGTGVWTIDALRAETVAGLAEAAVEPVLGPGRPPQLHCKDPVAFHAAEGATGLLFCTHPFTWASSNTALAVRSAGGSAFPWRRREAIARGPAWDVAATRVTDRLPVPPLGLFSESPPTLYFYDGAECLRPLEASSTGPKRARGYSCEEIGGLAVGGADPAEGLERLSEESPLFVSPEGTGCNRYVATLVTDEAIYAAWQMGRADGSQPLVGNALPMERVEAILTGRA